MTVFKAFVISKTLWNRRRNLADNSVIQAPEVVNGANKTQIGTIKHRKNTSYRWYDMIPTTLSLSSFGNQVWLGVRRMGCLLLLAFDMELGSFQMVFKWKGTLERVTYWDLRVFLLLHRPFSFHFLVLGASLPLPKIVLFSAECYNLLHWVASLSLWPRRKHCFLCIRSILGREYICIYLCM